MGGPEEGCMGEDKGEGYTGGQGGTSGASELQLHCSKITLGTQDSALSTRQAMF